MIVFQEAPAAVVRAAEALVAGRRIACRLFPYGPEGDAMFPRFDPVERRFHVRRHEAVVPVGPWDVEPWTDALSKAGTGPVLIGPCSSAEAIRGAYRAAAEAAVSAGRAVYLLDPEVDGVPGDCGRAAVALCLWRPGRIAAFPSLEYARACGLPASAVFPLVPGWTGESPVLEELAAAAAAGGAVSLTGVAPAFDGEARRGIVEVRSEIDPAAAEDFFEFVHHGAWTDRMAAPMAQARAAARRHGLAVLPPRPVGAAERAGNAAASARLEELADEREAEEHRAALAHAAVRWIDDTARDLAAVAREGNFRKVFPFGADLAEEAEAAFREVR